MDKDRDRLLRKALKTRQILFFPFMANLVLILRTPHASRFIIHVQQELLGHGVVIVPVWMFYVTATVLGPAAIAVTRLLPNESYAVFGGGLLTTLGLALTGILSGPQQSVIFGVLVGCGTCLSFTASCIGLSPYFGSRKKLPPSCILLASMAVIMTQHICGVDLFHQFEAETFYILALMTIVVSIMPLVDGYIRRGDKHQEMNKPEVYELEDGESHCHLRVCCKSPIDTLKTSCSLSRWMPAFLSVMVWITWGIAGTTTWLSLFGSPDIDASWLSAEWFAQNNFQLNIVIFQFFISLLVFTVKFCTEQMFLAGRDIPPGMELLFSSNYMHLGLLGAAGIVFSMFPGNLHPIHIQILFSMTITLQFDDLSDREALSEMRHNDVEVAKHTFDTSHRKTPWWKWKRVMYQGISVGSVIVLSALAMCQGIYFANMAGHYIKAVQHLPLFTYQGLFAMSIISVIICMIQPISWLKNHQAGELSQSDL